METSIEGLQIKKISKTFAGRHALRDVSFTVNEGEIVSVLGPSGSGKSTLLSIIAGLESPEAGEVLWKGKSILHVPPHKRGFGLMFQDFALFPHMNVFDNVSFGLRMLNMEPDGIQNRVKEVLELVGLKGFDVRDVNTLSGGEQQRVALARSLASHPKVLMLDEPLGSLDRNLRERLLFDLRAILQRMHQTAIYVTHDQEEALSLADKVVLFNSGMIEQIGSPQELYCQPATLFTARFLGLVNLLPGQVIQQDGKRIVESPVGNLPAPNQPLGEITLLIRPDRMRTDGSGTHRLAGQVQEISFRGSIFRAIIRVNDTPLTFDFLSNAKLPREGETIELVYEPEQAIQFISSS